ncbi:hypothetical protein [Halobellus limi]|uniref:SWIM-type domain-containing protein n=1 Tax=Halobellus limi TaxID=699433 RepID=A0A1H5SZ43_9EURY|nr:hypothetical protein [Halobellus limi]QCC47449.1 hypothetical protein DV707_07110 [Halobellus limi]SEF55785.1 hypothetical protein SAMN04488133_0122 [Halobellus limi]
MNPDLPHQARRVDPYAARDAQSEPFRRARDEEIDIEPDNAPNRSWVQVGDGDKHRVALVEDQEGLVGYCDCDGFAFHEGELAGDCCTHIIAMMMESVQDESLITTIDDVVETGGSPMSDDGSESSDVEVVDVDQEASGDGDRDDHAEPPTPSEPEAPTPKIDDPFAEAIEGVDDRFVMTLGGDPYIRREGFQRLARQEGYRTKTEMVTFQGESDNELAEARAWVYDGESDDLVATGTGTAYLPDEDLSGAEGNLNELAETRALSRAMGWATGAGLSAVEVDASAEYDSDTDVRA